MSAVLAMLVVVVQVLAGAAGVALAILDVDRRIHARALSERDRRV